MNWKAKILAVLRWARDVVNLVVDPPPARIKWYILATLIIAVGGGIVGAKLRGGAVPAKRVAAPVYLMPRMPSVVTTTLPPRSKDLAPLATLGEKPKARKGYRKPKCDAVFC